MATSEESSITNEFINRIYPTTKNKNFNAKMGVLDIFDLRTVSQLKLITDLNQRLSLLNDYLKAAEIYNQSLDVNFNNINTVDGLFFLAQKMYGTLDFKLRDYDVIMTFDNDGISTELPLTEIAYKRIQNNPFLKTKSGANLIWPDGTKVNMTHVDYAGRMQYLKAFEFPPEAQSWSRKKIVEEGAKILLDALVNPYGKKYLVKDFPDSLFDQYKLFLSLHPFQDGNGRFSRLLYLVIGNKLHTTRTERGLTLPMYDLDLFLDPVEFKQQIQIGAMMKVWVASSTTPEMFIIRSEAAMDMLKKYYPHLSSLME